jgi:hypothetical protein
MAKSNYGFINAGGLAGVQKGIQEVLAQRIEAQELAHKQLMAERAAAVSEGNLEVNRGDLKQRTRQWDAEAPGIIALRKATAEDLIRRPEESLKDHERRVAIGVQQHQQDLARLAQQNVNELGQIDKRADREDRQIGMRGAEQRLTDRMDPSNRAVDGPRDLSAAAQVEVKALNTIEALVNEISTLGQKTNWSGVGGLGMGSAQQFLKKNFGVGSDEGQSLRANIGNLRSSVSQARAGLTLTENEERMLDTFVGTIDSHPELIQANMRELMKWVQTRRASNAQIYKDPSLANRLAPGAGGGAGKATLVRDPKTGKLVFQE